MGHSRRLYRSLPFVCLATLALAAAGCSTSQPEVSLEFLADYNAPSGIDFARIANPASAARARNEGAVSATEFQRQQKLAGNFGGLSALAYDGGAGLLYALSDSSNLRLFILSPKLTESSLQVEPEAILPLVSASGDPIPVFALDPEGLAMTPEGELLVVSEGYAGRDPRVDPGIFRFGRDGRLLGQLPIPPHYLPRGDTGVRANVGFESLSISPDGASILAATERNLAQDEHECAADAGCLVRMLRYRREGGGWQHVAEYFYRTDPSIVSSLGLSELLWIDERAVLTLERGFERLDDGSTLQKIRIYQIALPDRLSQSEGQTPLDKRLVLDLDSVKDRFSEGFRRLDNYEGMSLGPQLPGGARTVFVVSDDNYNEEQRTSLLAFRLIER